MLYQLIPLGDFCRGLPNGLTFLSFAVLLLFSFLTIVINNVVKFIRHKQRFHVVPLVIVLVLGIIGYALFKSNDKKFWTTKVLTGTIESTKYSQKGSLTLYRNLSFSATCLELEYKCTFQGSYQLNGDTLKLKKNNLSELTDTLFTTSYILSKDSGALTPIDGNFKKVLIREITE